MRPNVPLTFVNADVAKDQIMALIARALGRPGRARPRHRRDSRPRRGDDRHARQPLDRLHDSGIDLRLAQVRGSVRDRMRRTGLMTVIGEERVYLSVEAAVAAPLPARC